MLTMSISSCALIFAILTITSPAIVFTYLGVRRFIAKHITSDTHWSHLQKSSFELSIYINLPLTTSSIIFVILIIKSTSTSVFNQLFSLRYCNTNIYICKDLIINSVRLNIFAVLLQSIYGYNYQKNTKNKQKMFIFLFCQSSVSYAL